MAITKQTETQIEIISDGTIQLRRTVVAVDDDGSELGRRHHRVTFPPTTPLADLPSARIRAHAQIEWTPEVIAAYKAKIAAANKEV